MRRIVYCPDYKFINNAEVIAKESGLSIQIGESPATKKLKFDRRFPQIIDVPTEREINFLHSYMLGECIWINVISDWNNFLLSDVYVDIPNEKIISPHIKEKHYVRFIHNISKKGIHKFNVMCDKEKIFDGEISIV
jgi:hypothetical protein